MTYKEWQEKSKNWIRNKRREIKEKIVNVFKGTLVIE